MPEIVCSPDSTYRAEGEKWKIAFDLPGKGRFSLSLGTGLSVTSLPVSISSLSETGAIADKRRIHTSGDGRISSLNADCRIPFGAEPAVKREFTLSESRLDVMTDLILRTSLQMETIDAGGLVFSGPLKKIGLIFPPDGRHTAPVEIKWFDFENNKNFYNAPVPPIAVLAVSEDGFLAEVSIGEDFWRWVHAPALKGVSEFKIESADDTVCFRWKLYQKIRTEDEEPVPGRNWRFNYYIAWGSEKSRKSGRRVFKSVFDLAKFQWDSSRLTMNAAGKRVKAIPCFTSNAVVNVLKQWIRGELATVRKGDVFLLKGITPAFCMDAAHLKRARQDSLPHFTLPAILDFRRWAEKQLTPGGGRIILETTEDSPFSKLPSLRN